MGDAIGSVLPLAVGIAISPVPIIAAILMLLSPRAKSAGVGFLVGWIVGIVTVIVVFLAIGAVLPTATVGGARPVQGGIHMILGLVLLGLAFRQFRSHASSAGAGRSVPKWMSAIDRFGFLDALGVGILLAAVNPKNLILGASAGVSVGSSSLQLSGTVIVIVVYTMVAASTIAVPAIAYLAAARTFTPALDRLRDWLERENSVIMGVLLLVMGAVVLAKGIAYF